MQEYDRSTLTRPVFLVGDLERGGADVLDDGAH